MKVLIETYAPGQKKQVVTHRENNARLLTSIFIFAPPRNGNLFREICLKWAVLGTLGHAECGDKDRGDRKPKYPSNKTHRQMDLT